VTRGNWALTRFRDYLKAYYRVCRLEYLPGEIPAVFTVLFLGSASVSRFFDLPVIEALVAFLLLYLSGFIINALADKEIDQKYDTFKTSIPKSVDLFGEKTLKTMIVAHVVIAAILAFHITLQMGSLIPVALVFLGVFFGLGYSVKPFHFKVKGVWHAIALSSSAFFLPFVFLMFVITAGNITLPLMIFILGFSFVHYGMEFGNQAIDYIEDRDSDVRTPPVRWGMITSLRVALGCVVFGIVTEGWSLYHIILSKGSFTYIHPILTTNVVYVAALGIILVGYYIPIKGLWNMHSTLKKSDTIEDSMPTLKKICNYAKWQTSGILGVAIASAILFVGVVFSPVAIISDTGEYGDVSEYELEIASEPVVEFYEEDGKCEASVSVSILNDDTVKKMGSLMIWVESRTANFRFGIESVLLEYDLMPNEYWNVSTTVRAHDVDDTTIKVYLYALTGQSGISQVQIGDPWIIHSQKDLYIHNVNVEIYEDIFHDKKANVTVTVFNQGSKKFIGDLEVEVWCYTSYWMYPDKENEHNNITLSSNELWSQPLTLNVFEGDPGNPIFVINLFYEGGHIDEYTFYS
jgi:4-hydroxybenzoate polyprenyltransferase